MSKTLLRQYTHLRTHMQDLLNDDTASLPKIIIVDTNSCVLLT